MLPWNPLNRWSKVNWDLIKEGHRSSKKTPMKRNQAQTQIQTMTSWFTLRSNLLRRVRSSVKSLVWYWTGLNIEGKRQLFISNLSMGNRWLLLLMRKGMKKTWQLETRTTVVKTKMTSAPQSLYFQSRSQNVQLAKNQQTSVQPPSGLCSPRCSLWRNPRRRKVTSGYWTQSDLRNSWMTSRGI